MEVNLSFEDALARLETVVQTMENEETSLEMSISLYKEGVTLSKHCNEILGRFEAEVTVLQEGDNNSSHA